MKQHQAIEDVRAKQRNTVWPDAMINSRSVDAFLWKGSPNAPLVQRIGAWIFGLTFILLGLGWVAVAYEKDDLVFGVLSIAWFAVGGKVFSNGIRRRKVEKPSDHGTDEQTRH
jgi:hypothetical protein